MNKTITIQKKKAGLFTCLFLFIHVLAANSQQDLVFNSQFSQAYAYTVNLQFEEARNSLIEVTSTEQIYIASLADMLELLLTEDEVKFEKYETQYESRLEQLVKLKQEAITLFSIAELRLQWAFVYLKFGHEFDAAWNIRQAYLVVQSCKKEFPDFLPIKKTSGILEVMLGSVPEKYQWVISLLGMQGSVEKGLKELEQVKTNSNTLHFETSLVYYLIQGYILQRTDLAVNGLHRDLQHWPDNKLAVFFCAALSIKNSQSENALELLFQVKNNQTGIPIAYLYYQLGEIYLHKGDYNQAVQSYQTFLTEYHGLNYLKDAHYKTGVCYWLAGDAPQASTHFNNAKEQGRESTEADKYAARRLAEEDLPHVILSKIRYATDGGYYDDAKKIVASVKESDLKTTHDNVEFIYRKARLYDKSGSPQEAVKLYKETIALQGDDNWYFAPNACLQLGYAAVSKNNVNEARFYFEKALSYKKHEYKNSIDSKAKSALGQLEK